MLAVKTDKITGDALGTGRRKTAVARVRVRAGSGKVTVNGRAMEDFFHVEGDRRAILDVLQAVGKVDSVDVVIRVAGGGPSGQAAHAEWESLGP